jgi:carboxyl-terminal processing protease
LFFFLWNYFFALFCYFFAFFLTSSSVFAADVTLEDFLAVYYTHISSDVPESYRYIQLEYTNIQPGTALYKAMQKAVYLDLFPNSAVALPLQKKVTEEYANRFLERDLHIKFNFLSNTFLTHKKLSDLLSELPTYYEKRWYGANATDVSQSPLLGETSFSLFTDVYESILEDHVDKDTFTARQLIDGAIKWMTEATNDAYTTYYTPEESASFHRSLEGEFEWIGAYLEKKDNVVQIVSPVAWSPADKAWLQAGDIIVQVDDFFIFSWTSIYDVINVILWPKGTSVVLKIQRWSAIFDVTIIRDVISLEGFMYEELSEDVLYLDINSFNVWLEKKFDQAAVEFGKMQPKKVIIDMTDNPGGSLDAADRVLHYFIPAGKPTIYIEEPYNSYEMKSKIVPATQFLWNAEIIIMINSGSASASEIVAATIKDYYPQATIVGTQSFGKGSVQRLNEYDDGSLFKLTIAKRYSGKTHVGIHHVGVTPDISVSDDPATEQNEILEKAKSL